MFRGLRSIVYNLAFEICHMIMACFQIYGFRSCFHFELLEFFNIKNFFFLLFKEHIILYY